MTEQAAGQQPQQQFQLQRIFLKDLSYEAPKTPQLFKEQWKPDVNLEVNNTANEVEDGIYKFENVPDPEAFGITLEPAGGSEAPTLSQLYTLGTVSP